MTFYYQKAMRHWENPDATSSVQEGRDSSVNSQETPPHDSEGSQKTTWVRKTKGLWSKNSVQSRSSGCEKGLSGQQSTEQSNQALANQSLPAEQWEEIWLSIYTSDVRIVLHCVEGIGDFSKSTYHCHHLSYSVT